MNFHYELHRRATRRALARCGCRQLRILDVRAHELTAARAPEWEACRIRYYPAVGRMSIRGPAGQYIAWTDTLAAAIELLAYADTSQVLPGNGLLNRKEPLQ